MASVPVPEKGTPEHDLWVAALEVAIFPALTPNASAYAAKVPWSRIERLRAAFDACGIDWRKVKAS